MHLPVFLELTKMNKLSFITIPRYTQSEEKANSLSHLLGFVFSVFALYYATYRSLNIDKTHITAGCIIYGLSMAMVYAVSAVYHALPASRIKKIMRIADHCVIYLLIAGTYTLILLCALYPSSPKCATGLMLLVWGCAAVGIILNAADMKRYSVVSMILYICMGWCIVLAWHDAVKVIPFNGLMWLLFGGISYTVGAVAYGFGKRIKYMHTIFHLFVLAGSIMQFVCIVFYIL